MPLKFQDQCFSTKIQVYEISRFAICLADLSSLSFTHIQPTESLLKPTSFFFNLSHDHYSAILLYQEIEIVGKLDVREMLETCATKN